MSVVAEEPQTTKRVVCLCGEEVLEVPLRVGGLTILLDPREVYPREQCRTCKSARLRDSEYRWDRDTGTLKDAVCWRCGARPGEVGYVGEELSGFGAAVGEDDLARPVDLSRAAREPGEAIYRAHRCPLAA